MHPGHVTGSGGPKEKGIFSWAAGSDGNEMERRGRCQRNIRDKCLTQGTRSGGKVITLAASGKVRKESQSGWQSPTELVSPGPLRGTAGYGSPHGESFEALGRKAGQEAPQQLPHHPSPGHAWSQLPSKAQCSCSPHPKCHCYFRAHRPPQPGDQKSLLSWVAEVTGTH